MPVPLDESLTALAQAFSVQKRPGQTPAEFAVKLVSPNPPDQPLTVVQTITKVIAEEITFSWITKDVRFQGFDITQKDPIGGMPAPLSLTGTPGALGSLTGKVPIPREITESLDVTVTARWRARDQSGNSIAGLKWKVGQTEQVGGDFSPDSAEALKELTLVFPVRFVEATLSVPVPVVRGSIQASIRLTAGGFSTGWIDLPPVAVILPVVPVPTVAVLFEDADFKGYTLILVPKNSPIDPENLNVVTATLGSLRNAWKPLAPDPNFTQFFLPALAAITDRLMQGGKRIVGVKADEVANLWDIVFEPGGFLSHGFRGGDIFSSLILIGIPGRQLQCFNRPGFEKLEGQFDVSVGGELAVRIANLHDKNPKSEPGALVNVVWPPMGHYWRDFGHPHWEITIFGDELSSVRFAQVV